jgi:hypothetical protein
MWLKTVDGSYYNMLTGTQVGIQEARSGNDFRVMVINQNSIPTVCLQNGYLNKDDAQDALDGAMEDQEVATLTVPEYEESTVEGEESTEDETVDYGNMSNAQLRNELASRDLSTDGNKSDMITRLDADDAIQAQGQE